MTEGKRYWAQLPWQPRDIRAMVALVASIVGSGVMTLFSVWLVYILWLGGWGKGTEDERIKWLGIGMIVLLGGMLMAISALGMAINRRSFKGKALAFELEASGGGDDDDSPQFKSQNETLA